MAEIVFIGGGIVGLSTALLLGRDGHHVTVLERDPAPAPGSADAAWEHWPRRGVNQFRQLHYLLPRFREIAEQELPDLVVALEELGALRFNVLAVVPEEITGGYRAEDDRFGVLTARRPVCEMAVARTVDAASDITIRRGAAVKGLLTDGPYGAPVPHVVGVVTDEGEQITADLVVDAGGRRSALPRMLADIGSRPPYEELEDCGFVYYGRHFRSADGSLPPLLGPILQPYDSVSILGLPADNGTWGLGLIASSNDDVARAAKDNDVWMKVIGSYPLMAHWADAEPITDVSIMAKIEDRYRRFVVDGSPVATGVVALADSWACTNPSVGRGISIGLMHGQALRDVLRAEPPDDPFALVLAFDAVTDERVTPYYRDTLAFDRHRLGEMEAQIAGVDYETDDPGYHFGNALAAAAGHDPELFRGFMEVVGVLARGEEVLARPGVAERVLELGADPEPLPGPSRAELVALLGG